MVTLYLPVIDHLALAGIYNTLYGPVCVSSTPSQHLSRSWFSTLVTHTLIPEGSSTFIILPGLGCCSFLLILITGHGQTGKNLLHSRHSFEEKQSTFPVVAWISHSW